MTAQDTRFGPSRPLLAILFGLGLVAAGLGAGFYVGLEHGHAEGHADSGQQLHPPHLPGDDHHEHVVLPPQTLANLGVVVAKVDLVEFVQTVEVRARIEDSPLNRRPIFAPTAGVVRALHAAPGQPARAAAPLVSIWQAPLQRPDLPLTRAIVAPVNEELHEVFGTLRSARAEFDIRRAQLARLQASESKTPNSELPAVPPQVIIDARNAMVRAERALENARSQLAFHGLAKDEIGELESHVEREGEHTHSLNSATIWQRALRRHGLWPEALDSALAALPAAQRQSPWVTALLGELTAAGRLPANFAQLLNDHPALGLAFERTACRLLAGDSIGRLIDLGRRGALAESYTVSAPATPELALDLASVDTWLVTDVRVRVGEQVEAGTPIAELYDPRAMRLVLEPNGSAIAHVRAALQARVPFSAQPTVAGSGPILEDLVLVPSAIDGRPGSAFARCTNHALKIDEDSMRPSVAFGLQPGLRYTARVPILRDGQPPRHFVVPSSALTEIGADRVVFRLGDEPGDFDPVPVRVVAEDSRQIAIAADGALQPGDVVVQAGAMGLGLAIRAAQGDGPPAHDHSH